MNWIVFFLSSFMFSLVVIPLSLYLIYLAERQLTVKDITFSFMFGIMPVFNLVLIVAVSMNCIDKTGIMDKVVIRKEDK